MADSATRCHPAPIFRMFAMPVLADSPVQTQAKLATVISRNNAALSQGAMGPIRTETFSDLKPKVESEKAVREIVRRDLELQRYPMVNNVAIP